MTQPVAGEPTKGAIPWMARNPVAANLLMIVLLVGGLIMAFGIKQEVFPDFEVGAVSVSVTYPGAGPEEVERGVVLAIEEAVQGLDGIDKMVATAGEGFGRVTIEVREGMDVRSFAQEVESEVNAITSFPDEAERPMTAVVTRKRHVISHAVYGDLSHSVLTQLAEDYRDLLLQDPLITQVELQGTRDHEIQVSIPQENLRRYGLTLAGVAERIRNLSIELPGGSVRTRGGEIMVRMKERRDVAAAYANLPIITDRDGSRVLLEDIAQINEGFEETNRYATFNGLPAIMVEVFRVGNEKPIDVAEAARTRADMFQKTLPKGVDISMVSDRSEVFEQRAELLVRNGYIGLGLVFILLALFLEIRLAFWVSLGIPISILGSFVFLPMTDFSINIVSMFAFIVTLGIVVDDAIVVGENIYYYREQGEKFMDAAIMGAKDMAVPVVFSILTNVAAFLPIMFVTGTMGKFFKVIPLVVIMVFLISLVESLFILPAHLSRENRPPGKLLAWIITRQKRISQGLTWLVRNIYHPFLKTMVKNRYITAATGIAVLIIMVGYVKSDRITTTLMPRIESDYAFVTATLPYGASDEKTAAVRSILTDAAKKVVDDNGAQTLSRGRYTQVNENVITSRIILTAPDVRPMSTAEVTGLWREAAGSIPGLESVVFQSDRGGPGSGASLTIELSHRDIHTLDAASMMLADELANFPSTKDIDDGSAQGKKQVDFTMKPQGLSLGLGARDVALQVRHAYYGATALKLQRNRNEITVKVRLPETERDSVSSLETLMIYTPDGRETLLTDVVSMTPGRAYTSIVRRDGRRTATVTADVVPQQETNRVLAVVKSDILPRLQQRFPGLTAGFEGRQASMEESTQSLIRGLILALFGIYALLAIPFKSYFQPMIIMACIPFGIVGAVLGHILLGFSLSLMSLFGLVALSGVVVNGSLVMVDSANKHRRLGKSAFTAITMAAAQRFRPIMLTTLTTFGGLSPMIFETSRQAQYLIPMAISLGFGIVFATLITLALVPCFYMILEDVLKIFTAPAHQTIHKG